VKFGLFLPLSGECADPCFLREASGAAENLGYDVIWVEDHYNLPWTETTLEAWSTLPAIASWTSGIRLGTCVTPIPLRPPQLLAKAAATVDVLSGGRLEFSGGLGWVEREFRAFGLPWEPLATRARRTREALELVMRLWAEERVSHSGEFYGVREASLLPKPVQRPHPPIWLGGVSRAVLRLVAEIGDAWIPWQPTPEVVRMGADGVSRLASLAGRIGFKPRVGVVVHAVIARGREEAWALVPPDRLEDARGGSRMGSSRSAARAPWVVGSPRDFAERVEEYAEAGAEQFSASFTPRTREKILEEAALFAKEVMPSFA